MPEQPRVVKILSALVVSMTIGAILLMALGDNAPSGVLFSLSAYRELDPIKKAISSLSPQSPDRWNQIEVYYSGTKAGNIEQLASLEGLSGSEDINCHFCICNGLGGDDGQIEPSERWQRQWSSTPGKTWYGSGQTIRICVISDGEVSGPTNYQRRRLTTLIETLCRRFNIKAEQVYYPGGWQ